ncbi:MAG: hypothetical protein HGB12_17750, partial [Bacteroidetes bacterium]|nr:hypothetical protein [Bacteroidota bacterium]
LSFTFCINLFASGIAGNIFNIVSNNSVAIISIANSPSSALIAPLAIAGSGATETQITANWNASDGATHYHLDVSTSIGFANFVSGFNNYDVDNVTSYNVTGLTCGINYYYRIRAENTCNTSPNSIIISYTTPICWVCGSHLVDARDDKSYNTVLIGSQCWMAENLNTGTKITGTINQTNNSTIEKYCYSDLESNCDTYGGYYQWAEAIQYLNGAANTSSWSPVPSGNVQGICPAGWHIPKDAEWTSLTSFLGSGVAGGKMKVSSSNTPPWDGTNNYGFSALPAGYCYGAGDVFYLMGTETYFLSATENSAMYMWYIDLKSSNNNAFRTYDEKKYGYSVRCLKD